MDSSEIIFYIAPCGMNCSVCMAYMRKRNKCSGCRGTDTDKPKTRINCKIKTCQKLNSEFCFSCNDYPCEKLMRIDKRYRTKYNLSMIENLEQIKNDGIFNFVSYEKERWRCTKCSGTICVHEGKCINCGEAISGKKIADSLNN